MSGDFAAPSDEIAARRNGKNTAAVEQFNEVCPVGSPVIYWPGERLGAGAFSRTRSVAWLLGGHSPVVMVEDHAGGIALTHVQPYRPAEHGCDNYSAPVTCLTAPSTVTGRCDHCKGADDA